MDANVLAFPRAVGPKNRPGSPGRTTVLRVESPYGVEALLVGSLRSMEWDDGQDACWILSCDDGRTRPVLLPSGSGLRAGSQVEVQGPMEWNRLSGRLLRARDLRSSAGPKSGFRKPRADGWPHGLFAPA